MTNLEIIKEKFAARARGEPSPPNLYADDIEWDEGGGHPYGGTVKGWENVQRDVISRLRGEWDEIRLDPEEFLDAGDVIIVLGKDRGRVAGTGVEMVAESVHFYWMRDGQIVKFRQYTDSKAWWEALASSEK